MDLQKLIQLSTKGDKQALEDLFKLGETLLQENKIEEAAKVFKESAISYRIASTRNFAKYAEATGKAGTLKEELMLLKQWIDLNTHQNSSKQPEGITEEFIYEILGHDIWPNCNPDQKYFSLMTILENSLDQVDGGNMPANSPFRRVVALMSEYYGLSNSIFKSQYLNNQDVRIWADLLAEEINKRFLASNTDN